MRTALAIGSLVLAAALAVTGRAAAVQDFCLAGATLESQGRFAQAEALYLKAMESELASQRACGAEKLRTLTGGSGVCAYAQSLESTSPNKAATAYRLVLRSNPEAQCAKDGLAALKDSFAERVAGIGTSIADVLLFLLAVAAGLYVAFVALMASLGRWRTFRRWVSPLPWVWRFLAPRLKFPAVEDGAVDPSLGAELASLMRGRLAGADDTSVVLASAETKLSDSLAPVKELSPQLGLAAGLLELLNSLLPRSLFTAGGVLHGELAGGRGPGVSLWVEKDGRSDVAGTFWRTDVLGADDETTNAAVHRLSGPAAAWLLHRVVKDTDRPILLTADSRSYALMAAGREWHDADVAERAWALYFGALALDPENAGALLNVAGIFEAHGWILEAMELRRRALVILEDRASAL